MSPDLVEQWPPAGVRLLCGDLELRFGSDDLLVQLADLAAEGVHAPDFMPFTQPWTRGTPDDVRRSLLQYQWGMRGSWSAAKWSLELAVLRDGEVLGIQGVYAKDFAVTREAETGSWLGLRHQGQGVGTLMRLAILHLLFDGLGAQRATTSAFEDNGPSNGVTRRLGYRTNGDAMIAREGAAARSLRYVLDREAWECRADDLRPDIALEGVPALRAFVGLSENH
ncbi:GNAT family N-acetyltransferase [Cellulomonas gelida]|uniref:Putative succinyl-CoA transferase n=1 Tax=Cellulomonas gelida TaxID=1712 RepID=A0A4Y3KPQ7_9CELL|nr:GNAT family protein [Cellulomonas gelida]GEA85636.1 putative succinyl-CoA transferase [Cellulomonas gelida]GGL21027.1 putative succinyl-CoA transferase [Cellulomonas gelida]